MEIVKRGTLPSERIYEFTCMNCQSIIRASQAEGHPFHDRDGNGYIFNCPVCKKDCYVDVKAK